jgi:hypothetical protein
LAARISHLFSVLASSFKLEYPLNDVLPNIENRRDALLAKIFEFRRSNNEATEADYELLYAYGEHYLKHSLRLISVANMCSPRHRPTSR